MRDLNALDPMPALGKKVERPRPVMPADIAAVDRFVFEAGRHNFFFTNDGELHRVTEADCRQIKPRTGKPLTVADITKEAWAILSTKHWRIKG